MENKVKFNVWNRVGKEMYYDVLTPDNWSFSFLNQEVFIWLKYVGLKDNSGKDIFRGDIIEFIVGLKTNNPQTVRAEIIYPVTDNCDGGKTTHAAFGYNASVYGEREGFYLTLCDVNILNIAVIGNIYEHSELLNSKP